MLLASLSGRPESCPARCPSRLRRLAQSCSGPSQPRDQRSRRGAPGSLLSWRAGIGSTDCIKGQAVTILCLLQVIPALPTFLKEQLRSVLSRDKVPNNRKTAELFGIEWAGKQSICHAHQKRLTHMSSAVAGPCRVRSDPAAHDIGRKSSFPAVLHEALPASAACLLSLRSVACLSCMSTLVRDCVAIASKNEYATRERTYPG